MFMFGLDAVNVHTDHGQQEATEFLITSYIKQAAKVVPKSAHQPAYYIDETDFM